jgi:heat shock protein HslJ
MRAYWRELAMDYAEYSYEAEQQPKYEQNGDRRAWIVIGVLAVILFACICVLGLMISYYLFFAEGSPAEPGSGELMPIPVEQIQNITWQWVELIENEPPGQSVVPGPAAYTLAFGADGQFTFRADCNVGSGVYSVDGRNLNLQIGAVTMAECGPASLSTEYMGLLGTVATYGMDDARLVLGLEEAVGHMVFISGGSAQQSPGEVPAGVAPTTVPPPAPTPTMGSLPLPIPIFPPEASVGEAVAFDGSQSQPGSSPIQSFRWEFGDGISGDGASVTHAYIAPGVYAVTLSVTGGDGLSSSATGQITVSEAVAPQPTPGPEPTTSPETGLVGPNWRWSQLVSEGQPSDVPDPENYTLRFEADLSLQIRSDCNVGMGRYTVEGSDLTLDLSGFPENDCGPDSLSDQYLELLSIVEEYELDEGLLLLYPVEDADRIVFAP